MSNTEATAAAASFLATCEILSKTLHEGVFTYWVVTLKDAAGEIVEISYAAGDTLTNQVAELYF